MKTLPETSQAKDADSTSDVGALREVCLKAELKVQAWWQGADEAKATVACQYVWGARPGHRDELILRDRNTGSSSSEDFDERLWSLMDYYDPTSTVNPEGEVVERYQFSAFGLRSILAPDFSPRAASHYAWDFGFKGQFLDVDTSYYNYGFRYNSPELGRWLSRDLIGERGGNNLYLFSNNSPIDNIDKFGLQIELDTNWKPLPVWQHGILQSTVNPDSIGADINFFEDHPGSIFQGPYILKSTDACWGVYECVHTGGESPRNGNKYFCSFNCDKLLNQVEGSPPDPLAASVTFIETDPSTCLKCAEKVIVSVYTGYGSPSYGYSSTSLYVIKFGSALRG